MVTGLPYRPQVDHTRRARTTVSLGDGEGTEMVQAIGSQTAGALVGVLQTAPAPASELADAVDTSLQNVQYHLDRLCDVGLVEPVETWYSTRGHRMTVYAPTSKRLVIDFEGPSAHRAESPRGE